MTDQPPLANLITLGARNFTAQRDFYRRVGWPQIMDDGEFTVFALRGCARYWYRDHVCPACGRFERAKRADAGRT
jgi:hypothetical protein